jgi:hypothetical protein
VVDEVGSIEHGPERDRPLREQVTAVRHAQKGMQGSLGLLTQMQDRLSVRVERLESAVALLPMTIEAWRSIVRDELHLLEGEKQRAAEELAERTRKAQERLEDLRWTRIKRFGVVIAGIGALSPYVKLILERLY